MILDAIVIVIAIAFAIYGYKKGFVFTLIQTVGWVLALCFAYLLTPRVAPFLKDSTNLFDMLQSSIDKKVDVSLDAIEEITESLPSGLQIMSTSSGDNILSGVSEGFANVFGIILVFIVLFILIKLILWVIQRLVSRDYRHGFVNVADGILGAIFGLLRAALAVCLLFMLIIPLITLVSTDLTGFINNQLDSSFFSDYLYKNNPVIMLIQGYMAS